MELGVGEVPTVQWLGAYGGASRTDVSRVGRLNPAACMRLFFIIVHVCVFVRVCMCMCVLVCAPLRLRHWSANKTPLGRIFESYASKSATPIHRRSLSRSRDGHQGADVLGGSRGLESPYHGADLVPTAGPTPFRSHPGRLLSLSDLSHLCADFNICPVLCDLAELQERFALVKSKLSGDFVDLLSFTEFCVGHEEGATRASCITYMLLCVWCASKPQHM
jgi:hypothetical protein